MQRIISVLVALWAVVQVSESVVNNEGSLPACNGIFDFYFLIDTYVCIS